MNFTLFCEYFFLFCSIIVVVLVICFQKIVKKTVWGLYKGAIYSPKNMVVKMVVEVQFAKVPSNTIPIH